jgi:hypothetical protein
VSNVATCSYVVNDIAINASWAQSRTGADVRRG